MPNLTGQHYGKNRVRVLKILRNGPDHTIKDVTVSVLLAGDFAASYTSGDNSKVIPTDTIKNTIQILAKQHLGDEIERFAIALGDHFLTRYPQVDQSKIEIEEHEWRRMDVSGKPHRHSFLGDREARSFTRVLFRRDSRTVESGIRDLLILKSTGSGFENYPRDEFTTLPETSDRILASSFSAAWTFDRLPEDCRAANRSILTAMLGVFAENYSPSAQATLYQMGEAALSVCAVISEVSLAMPNKHYLLIDLSRFGMENKNEIFVPTDEPHGQIEVTLAR